MGHTNKQSQLWNLVKVWFASESICMYAVNCAKCVIIPHMVYHGVWPSLAIVWVTPRAHVTLSLPLSRRFSSLLPTSAASTRALSQSKRPILHANREPWINYHRTHSFKLFPQNITFWEICNMNKLKLATDCANFRGIFERYWSQCIFLPLGWAVGQLIRSTSFTTNSK